jgi:NADH dehydrogenase
MAAARSRPRVLILGAGFAGLAAAREMRCDYDVTIIDRSPWFEWLPNVHELISGVKRPGNLRLPRRRLISRLGHRYLRGSVTGMDLERREVQLASGRKLGFDGCIVAVGGVNGTHGVRGVERNAWPCKSVDDCDAIGRRLRVLGRGRKPLSVVVVGGGLEGVEILGEVLRRYRRRPELAVTIVEAGPRLMPGTPEALDASVRRHTGELPVRILIGRRVTAVTPQQVRLDSGTRLRSDLTIWTGGIVPTPLLQESGLATRSGQWAAVEKTLQSRSCRSVFVAGDAAGLPQPLAKQAYYALQMGECAAKNLDRFLRGRRLLAFRPSPKPMLVAFGDLDTYLVAGRSVVASPALAAAKEAVYQVTMAQLDPPRDPAALRGVAARAVRFGEALPLLSFLGSRRD